MLTVSFLKPLFLSVSLHWRCTSFSILVLLFVSLSPLSVLFSPLSLSLSLPLCPLSTSLLCVSGKACLINDTCHRVRSEGWVSDKWLCWKGNRLSGMAGLFSSWIGFQDPWRPERLSFPEKSTHPTRLWRSLPLGGVGDWERGWAGGGVGGIQSVPIVATVQLDLSQQRWDYFYKASDSVPRQQSRLKAHRKLKVKSFLCVTLLQHLHSSFSPEAQPCGLTSAKCVLKRREGPFHRPRFFYSSSSPPPAPPPLPPPLPSFSSLTLSFTHLLAGWHCYLYTGRIYGVRAYGKNKKASVNTCGKHSVSFPPPPSTGAHSLIRYALIRHIDHRRDSTSPESCHRTFISNGACKAKTFATLTPENNASGDVLLLVLANAVGPYVGGTIKSQLALPCCFRKGMLFTHKQQEGRQI